MYCDEHAKIFLKNYDLQDLSISGPVETWKDAVAFDLELLVYDYRPDEPSQLFLREIGGNRRLDCLIGVFEAAALQRELDGLTAPRPLTHTAMATIIVALGATLERVIVDAVQQQSRIYEAKLQLRKLPDTIVVDVRISDAVVLAVICKSPIFVSKQVLSKLK